jgi:glycosyltransferase involved in cell wall biosynthesis
MSYELPGISIITPVYNTGKLLMETYDSILAQTYKNWEWIIVDDGSDEETNLILTNLSGNGDPRIKVKFNGKKGACAARNFGIRLSVAPMIKFFDSDDLMQKDFLEKQYMASINSPDAIICSPYKDLNYLENGESSLSSMIHEYDIEDPLGSHLGEGVFLIPSLLYPRKTVETVGDWDESLAMDQDGDYTLRAIVSGIKFHDVADTYFIYRHHYSQHRITVYLSREKLDSAMRVCLKIRDLIIAKGLYNDHYASLLASRLHYCAFRASINYPDIMHRCLKEARGLDKKIKPYKVVLKGKYKYLYKIFGGSYSLYLRYAYSVLRNIVFSCSN